MDNQQTTLELIKAFLLADLVERDAQKALSFLSPDICWFGTGVEEDVHGIEQAKVYFDGEIALSPAAYQVVFLESNDQTRPDGTGAAQIKCRITGGGIEAICRCSGAVCLVDGEKRICSLHMSVPDTAQTQGEYFPFSLAQKYEIELREEFFDEMVDGGMLGRYNDPSGEICFVNRQMLEFLGYPSEEVFRKELHNCAVNAIYPEDRESSYRAMEEQLAKDKRYRVEYRMLRRDGSVLWVESHGKGITTKDGRSAMVGILNDITARKETQRLVQTRDQEIRNLYDTIPGGVFVCRYHSAGEVIFANKGFYHFLGYTSEEFAANFHNEMAFVICEEDRAPMEAAIEKQLAEGNYIENASRVRCKDGSLKWISIHAVLNESDGGDPCLYCTFVDITKQKEAERKLLESEQRYRVAIEGAGVNIWEYDIPNHRIILPKGSMRVREGQQVLECFPDSVMDQMGITKEQTEEMRDMFRRMEQGEKRVSGDFWVDSPKTHTRWCERVTYSVVFDDAGRPVKAYGASIDVTKSKLAEKQYQEELAYRDSVAESVIASSCVNLSTRKVETMRVQGRTVPEERCQDVVDFKQRALFFLEACTLTEEQNRALSPDALIRGYNDGVSIVSEEFLAKFSENRYGWVRADVNLIKHPDTGDILAFFYNHDLTDQLIRTNVMDTVLTKDYEEVGIVDLRSGIYKKSAGGGSLLSMGDECAYEDNLDLFCEKRVSAQDCARVRELLELEHLKEEIAGGRVYELQFLGRSSEGAERFFVMRFQHLGNNPEVMLITRQDLDDVVRREQRKQRQLEQAVEEARKANQIKSEFLSRMSHEIRTPLNAIIGLAELGKTNFSNPVPNREEGLDYVEKTLDASHYLLSIINDILDMNKIESGEIALVVEPMNCAQILDSVNIIIGTQATAKKIRFETQRHMACPEHVVGDATRVEQVLINLLGNAVKFTPEGGTVRLSIDRIEDTGTWVTMRFVVSDMGVGISPEFLPRVFEPFAQEYAGITTTYGGSGLGLSIARQLTRMMDGDLTVKSEKGKGAEFTAVMRFAVPGSELNPKEEIASLGWDDSRLQGKKILVCEDHPLNIMVVKRLLEQRGCSVYTAENGKLGVEAFSDSAPGFFDAVLMDIRMPVVDGLTAAKTIRSMNRKDAKSIPILAMTANAYEEDVRLSKEAGMDAHLAKPIEPRVLYQTLSAYLHEGEAAEE